MRSVSALNCVGEKSLAEGHSTAEMATEPDEHEEEEDVVDDDDDEDDDEDEDADDEDDEDDDEDPGDDEDRPSWTVGCNFLAIPAVEIKKKTLINNMDGYILIFILTFL